jgi:hypothetical protein
VGQGGLTGLRNVSAIDPNMLLEATNLSLYDLTLRKEGGAARYNAAPLGAFAITGGHDWWPDATTQRMVVLTGDGRLLKDAGTGAFGTTLKSGLTVTGPTGPVVPIFVEGGKESLANSKKLFMFSALNQVQVLAADGVTASAVATPPADWSTVFPKTGVLHAGRLWGFLGHRAYFSTTGNHEDFTGTGSGSMPVYAGEGEEIVAALSYKGQLLIWKYPVGIYLLNTIDPTITNWSVVPVSKGVGAAGPGVAIDIDDDVLFMDATGNFHLLSAVQVYGDVGFQNISTQNKIDTFFREKINKSRLRFTRGIWYYDKREIHFALSKVGATSLNCKVVLDFNVQGTIRFRFSDRDDNECFFLRKTQEEKFNLMMGDNSGGIWYLDQDDRNKDGKAFEGRFQTPHMDLSHVDKELSKIEKNFCFLEVVTETVGNWFITLDVYIDQKFESSIDFSLGASGTPLGTFVLGIDALGRASDLSQRRRMTGSGKRISLIGRNALQGGDFSISQIYIYYMRGIDS